MSGETRVSIHPHPLVILERDGWSCDGSKIKGGCESTSSKPSGTRRYHCAQGCNWDICEKCVTADNLPPPAPIEVTIHPHPLEILDRGGWSCDGASVKGGCESTASKPSGSVRYHCANGCNWDLCEKCLAATRKDSGPSSSSSSSAPAPKPAGPPPDYTVGRARLRDAKGVFYREELYKGHMANAEAQAAREHDTSCSEYVAFMAEMQEVKDGFAKYWLGRKIEDVLDLVKRKLSYAKSQPLSWKERVYETYGEVRKLLEQYRADPELSAAPEVQAMIEETEKTMLAHEDDLMSQVAASALDDDKGYVTRQLKYARDQGLRFMDRVESTHAEVRARLDKMEANRFYRQVDADVQQFIDQSRDAMSGYERELVVAKAKDDLEDDMGFIKRRFAHCVDNDLPRFPERAVETLAEIAKRLHKISTCEAFFGMPEVDDFLSEREPQLRKLQAETKALILGDQVSKAVWDPNHYLGMAFSDLDSIGLYQDRAIGRFTESQDMWAKLEFQHPDWVEEAVFLEHKAKFEERSRSFQAKYDAKVIQEEAKDAISRASQPFGFVESYRRGHFQQALGYLQESIDRTEELRKNSRLARLPQVQEFLRKHDVDLAAKKADMDEEVLAGELKDATGKALSLVGFVTSYFNSGHEGQALDYYQQSKDACEEVLTNPRFLGRPEVEAFLERYQRECQNFDELYRSTVLTKAFKDVTELATDNLSHAFTYFTHQHAIGQALDYLQKAKDAHLQALADSRFGTSPFREQMVEFDEGFRQRSKEFAQMHAKHVYDEEKKAVLSKANSALSFAQIHFDSHRNGQALEELRSAQSALSDIRQDPAFAEDPEIQAFLAEFPAKLTQFKHAFDERVILSEFRDKSSTALQNLSNAKIHFGNAAYGQAVEYFSQAKSQAAQVLADKQFEYPGLSGQLADFRAQFAQDSQAFQTTYDEKMLSIAIDDATSTALQLLSHARTYFESHSSQALDYYAQAKAKREQITTDHASWQQQRPEQIKSFLSEFDQTAARFIQDFADREFKQELDAAEALAADNLSHAHTYFDSHRTGQALEYYHAATSAVGKLSANEKFRGLARVDSFLQDFAAKSNDFQRKFQERAFTERMDKAQSDVTTNLSHARTYFTSHRRAQSLEYLRAARRALADFSADGELMAKEGSEDFVAGVKEDMGRFEEEYAEAVFKEELDAAFATCKQTLEFARQALPTDLARALSALQVAKQHAQELGSDAKFLNNAGVQAFLTGHSQEIAGVQAQLQAAMAAETLKKHCDSCRTLLSNAKIYFKSHHRSQAIEFLQKAKEALQEVQDLPSDPAAQSFVGSFSGELQAVQQDFSRQLFDEELSGIVKSAEAQLTDAEFHFSTRRRDQALEIFHKAKETATQLAEPKFFGVAEVDAFFAQWKARTDAFLTTFNSTVFAEQLAADLDKAKSQLDLAKAYFGQSLFDRCAEAIAHARDAHLQIADNPSYKNVAAASAFVASFKEELKAFSASVNQKMFHDEYLKETSQIKQSLQLALHLFNNHAVAQSVEAFNQTQAKLQALQGEARFADHAELAAFVQETQAALTQFALDYANKQLSAEARAFASSVQPALSELAVLASRGLFDGDNVAEKLKAAQEKFDGIENRLLLNHQAVQKIKQELAAFELQYANAALLPKAQQLIAQLTREFAVLAKIAERSGVEQAVSAFDQSIRKPAEPLWQGLLHKFYALLPQVKAFLAEVDAFGDSHLNHHKLVMVGESGSGGPSSSSSSSSSEKKSLVDVLGRSLHPPSQDFLRLPTIQLTVDIPPGIYNEIKTLNTTASRIFGSVREASRAIDKMAFNKPIGLKMALDHYTFDVFARGTAGYPIESLKADLIVVQKQRDSAAKEAPNDPVTQTLVENVNRFEQNLNEMFKLWEDAGKMGKEIASVLLTIDYLDHAMAHGKGCIGVNSNPNQLHLTHRASMMGVHVDGQSTDHEVFLMIIDRCDALTAKIARLSEQWGAFPSHTLISEKIASLRKEARALHPQHCIYIFLRMAGNKESCRSMYVRALRRFPLARRVLQVRLREQALNNVERRYHCLKEMQETQWHFNDPYANSTVADAFEETEAEYDHPYTVITPGAPEHPFGNRPDQSQSSHAWNATCKAYAGKIVFSKQLIEASVSSDSAFTNEFSASEEIFGRAFWPRSLRNYALAIDPNGKPLYGPEYLFADHSTQHTVELLLFVSVDGRPIQRSDQLAGEFSWFRVSLPQTPRYGEKHQNGSQTDFYAFTQTCRLHISLDTIDSPNDEWMNAANRFRRLFKSLCNGSSPSTHTVKLDLCFRIHPNHSWMDAKPDEAKFPGHYVPISHPIATGEFKITVPAAASAITLASMFKPRHPDCTLPRAQAAEYEELIKQWLINAHGWGKGAKAIERPIAVVLNSAWYQCSFEHFLVETSVSSYDVKRKYVKEPVQYGLECRVYFYRSVADNWHKEEIASFNLTAMGPCHRNPVASPPFTGVAVGGNYTHDVDLLPDSVLAQLPIKRCDPALRDGLFDLDKLPHLNFQPPITGGPHNPNPTSSSSSSPSSSSS